MNYLAKFRDIDTFIFDVDGVLTDGKLIITEEGNLLRSMNTKDGYAIKVALNKGYNVCIITGGNSKGVEIRLKGLGVTSIFSEVRDKVSTFNELVETNNLNPENVLYMGDDILDVELMKRVGLPACPNDAVNEVIERAHYISSYKGGDGCVRDVIEKVLKLNGDWVM